MMIISRQNTTVKSVAALKEDTGIGQDLLETLEANHERCIGMAANMIGVNKRIIVIRLGLIDLVMYNPVIKTKKTPYDTEEGCLSLDGVRKTKRYRDIEVEYFDSNWVKHCQKFSGLPSQTIQHEIDHLEGILI